MELLHIALQLMEYMLVVTFCGMTNRCPNPNSAFGSFYFRADSEIIPAANNLEHS